MDTKKLDKWADLLLDTGKRNNLINFKDTRASTVEVLLPTADALFEKIDGSTSFEVYDPKIIEEDEETEEFPETEQLQIEPPEESDILSGKAAFMAQYSGKIKRQNQILLYNSATNPLTAVKNIDKKAREFIEETGVNVAYMAFGFIHWKESDSSNYVFSDEALRSSRYAYRILFVPINAKRQGQADQVVEFVKSDSPLAEGLEKAYAVIKETEKRKYLPSEIVKLMKSKGYDRFSIHKHTELWKSRDARNSKYSYGVTIANTWYWYETWVHEVEKHCEAHKDELKS